MVKPKKKIEIVYYLIKRMSRTEKRLFKLYNQSYKGGKQDFIKLFDFINTMKNFDTKSIEEFFIKEKLKNKNICIAYLLNKLIESIDDGVLYLVYSGQEILAPHFKAYRTYVKMELMELAQKELLKLEQLAEHYELYEYTYQIYQMQERMANVLNINTYSREYREKLYLKQIELREKNKTREEIKYIISLIVNCPADSQEFKDANDRLLQYDYDSLPVVDKIEYNHARSWYYHLSKRNDISSEYIRKVIDVYHDNSHFIKPFIEDYIATWNNLLLTTAKSQDAEARLKYYEEYKHLAKKYETIFVTLPDAFIAFYELIGHMHEIIFNTIHEHYSTITDISNNTLKTIEKYPTSTSRVNIVASLFARLSYGFILTDDFEKAQFWLDKLANLQYINKTRFFFELAILKLILLYEEATFTLLKSEVRSLRRKWKANPPTLVSAGFMLESLHNVLSKRNMKKTDEFWKSAYEKILKIEAEKSYLLLYSKWIAQKI